MKLSGNGGSHRLQLELSNQTKIKIPQPGSCTHLQAPSAVPKCVLQSLIPLVTSPSAARPQQKIRPAATQSYSHPGGSVSEIGHRDRERETASTFGGFIWDEGDEMRESRNVWDETRGEEEIALLQRGQMFCWKAGKATTLN